MTLDEARTFIRLYREFVKAGFEIIFPDAYICDDDDKEAISFETKGEMIISLPDEKFAQVIAKETGGALLAE